jgi:hypothetical protein
MTATEINQLERLIEIAEEDDSPLNDWEKAFIESLSQRKFRDLSIKQADVFDRLVEKHL